jgi:hypothetical protein
MAPYNDANMAFILCCVIIFFVVVAASSTNTDLYTTLLAIGILFTPCFAVILMMAASNITQPLKPTFNGQPLEEV